MNNINASIPSTALSGDKGDEKIDRNEPRRVAFEIDVRMVDNPCVYLLFYQEVLMYVGSAVNVYARVRQHKLGGISGKPKQFDSAIAIPVPAEDMLRLEAALILQLYPVLNGGGNIRRGIPMKLSAKECLGVITRYAPCLVNHQPNRQLWPA